MRALSVTFVFLMLLGSAAAATELTRSYQGWTTRSPLAGLEPIVICDASGDGLGGACFPNFSTTGRATVRVKADSGTTVAAMLWAYSASGEQMSGDVICVDNNKPYSFRYNTGAAELVIGVGWWVGIGAFCASTGTPSGTITVTFP